MSDYDRWKTTPPEPKSYCTCDWCGDDIYEGEEYLKTLDGDRLHYGDCLQEYALDKLAYTYETANSQQDYEDYLADKADAERDERMINGEDW